MADIRRAPYKEKFVKDLGLSEFKVVVTGKPVGLQNGGFLLSDGTGEVFVNITRMENSEDNSGKEVLRVFGRLVPYESGFEIQAEIIQDLSGISLDALKKIKEAAFL